VRDAPVNDAPAGWALGAAVAGDATSARAMLSPAAAATLVKMFMVFPNRRNPITVRR
jgi:hypothetical protein